MRDKGIDRQQRITGRKRTMPADREKTAGDQKIKTRRTGKTVNVAFDNPGRHNAMALAMWERLSEVMAELAADPETRVVVLSGAGGNGPRPPWCR
jgi:1,4-dihydroxy-2-naphthoyl-CoA synthase